MKSLKLFALLFAFSATKAETLTPISSTQETTSKEKLTLKDALVGALNMPYVRPAQYGVQAAQENVSMAKRGWLPDVTLSTNYGATFASQREADNYKTKRSNGQVHKSTSSLTVTQNLYKGGQTTAEIKVRESMRNKAGAEYNASESKVLFEAIKAYSDMVKYQGVHKAYLANQKYLEERLHAVQSSYELGAVAISSVAQVEGELANIRGRIFAIQGELRKAQAALQRTTGLDPVACLESTPLLYVLPSSEEEAVHYALAHSFSLRAADAEADASKETARASSGMLLPSIDISASGNRAFQSNWSKTYAKSATSSLETMATAKIPLDFRGYLQANVRSKKYEAAKKRLEAMNTRSKISEIVRQKWADKEAARLQIPQREAQIKAAKTAYESMKAEFDAGTKTMYELLGVEEKYFAAQVELISAQQAYVQAAYDLMQNMGALTAEALEIPFSSFDAKKFGEKVPVWGLGIQEEA